MWQQSFKHQHMPENHASTKRKEEMHGKAFMEYGEGWSLHYNSLFDWQSLQRFTRNCFTNLCERMRAPLLQNKEDTFLSYAKNSSTGCISVLKASVINQNYHRRGFRVITSGFWMLDICKSSHYKKTGLLKKKEKEYITYSSTHTHAPDR